MGFMMTKQIGRRQRSVFRVYDLSLTTKHPLPDCWSRHVAIDAILGLYSDAQMECAARLLPEARLGEGRVEQMVRKGFAGHCMVQVRKCGRAEGWELGG